MVMLPSFLLESNPFYSAPSYYLPVSRHCQVPGDWTAWRAYLVGPVVGGAIAVGIAYVLRGRGGGRSGVAAAQGTLGVDWNPGSQPRS